MNTVIERLTASAAVVAAGALCAWLICVPAKADYYAFGSTQSPKDYATLTLGESDGKSVRISTEGFQGWFETNGFSIAGPDGNTNYLVGYRNGSYYDDFFGFDIAGVTTVTSAKLTVFSGAITTSLDYSLHGATQAITQLADGVSPNLAIYEPLSTGVKYGSFTIRPQRLDADAYLHPQCGGGASNQRRSPRKEQNVRCLGLRCSVPEPSTWAMLLIGFGGLGLAAYRRRAWSRFAVSGR